MNADKFEKSPGEIGEIMYSREIAVEASRRAAARGEPLSEMLLGLEQAGVPFFLGIEEDPDDSDLDVFP